MRRVRLNQTGVSMTELLISISIVSILSFVLMNFMVNWYQQHAITTGRSMLLADAQTALDFIGDTVRLSAAADQNNRWQDSHAPNAPANLFSWQSNGSTLVLASAAEDTSSTILFSDPANYISHKNNQIFFVQNGTLYRRTLAAPVANNKARTSCPSTATTASCPADRKLAEHVKSFSVTYLNGLNEPVQPSNARSVELTLVLSKQMLGQEIDSTYKTRTVFRNG